MKLLCVDPGSLETGYAAVDTAYNPPRIAYAGIMPNDDFIANLKIANCEHVAIEYLKAFGPSNRELIKTACMIGEIERVCKDRMISFTEITRDEVKKHLCGITSVGDPQVREELGHTYKEEVGRGKQFKGPLKGISKHALAALAVGVAFQRGGYEPRN